VTPPPSMIAAARFRQILGHVPTAVAVVTAAGTSGPVGMTVGTFSSVSLAPPLVGFMADHSSRTFPHIGAAGSFCANILAADQEPLCRAFARSADDKFDGVRWRPAPSGAPILDGVVAWVDCTLGEVHHAGDHLIVIGEVRAMDGCSTRQPLIFHRGAYGSVG
jgi:3-hydroxy-9,10-secoandrosta-1,3,5(10)-triene-9,17-dione monooxygenase reductase component